MVESSPRLPLLRSRKKALTIIGVVLALVIISGVMISTLPSLNIAKENPQETVDEPDVEITNTSIRTEPEDEHIVHVDLSLKNSGGPGTMEVHVTISDGTTQFSKNESVYFIEEESRNMTFSFYGVNFANMSDVHAYPWIAITQPD